MSVTEWKVSVILSQPDGVSARPLGCSTELRVLTRERQPVNIGSCQPDTMTALEVITHYELLNHNIRRIRAIILERLLYRYSIEPIPRRFTVWTSARENNGTNPVAMKELIKTAPYVFVRGGRAGRSVVSP